MRHEAMVLVRDFHLLFWSTTFGGKPQDQLDDDEL